MSRRRSDSLRFALVWPCGADVERFDVLFPQLARVMRPGGVFVTSHRAPLWDSDERGCRTAAEELVRRGVWSIDLVGEPEAYMPDNPDPVESSKTIRLLAFRVR